MKKLNLLHLEFSFVVLCIFAALLWALISFDVETFRLHSTLRVYRNIQRVYVRKEFLFDCLFVMAYRII